MTLKYLGTRVISTGLDSIGVYYDVLIKAGL
jgi:hypothetical protein